MPTDASRKAPVDKRARRLNAHQCETSNGEPQEVASLNMGVTDIAIPALICDLVVRSFPGAIEAHEIVNEVKFSIVPPAAFLK